MARDGGRADSAEEFERTFSRAADDGLLPEARPIDVDGLRSFRAEEGREADMQKAIFPGKNGEDRGLEPTFVMASHRQPFRQGLAAAAANCNARRRVEKSAVVWCCSRHILLQKNGSRNPRFTKVEVLRLTRGLTAQYSRNTAIIETEKRWHF